MTAIEIDAMAAEVVQTMKAAIAPVLADLTVLRSQMASLEMRWSNLGALRERVAVLETKGAIPGPVGPPGAAGEPGAAGAPGAMGPQGERGADGAVGEVGPVGLPGAAGAPGAMGPQGERGADGTPGLHGKDGQDGVGFDDMDVEYDGERAFTLKFTKGERVVEKSFSMPVMLYRGVFIAGKTYDAGDTCTWAGSAWIAHRQTAAKPGDGDSGWTLAVKTGRDGKPGQPGPKGADGANGKDGKPWGSS